MSGPVWEQVEEGLNRAAINDGWLVHAYEQRYDTRLDRWDWVLVCGYFVPDVTHSWNLADAAGNVAADLRRKETNE